MRKFMATLVAAAVLGAAVPVRAGAPVPTDLTGHWARTYVESGVSAGYVAGYPDGTFKPDRSISRAEFFKLLTGALRKGGIEAPTAFTDTDHWSFQQGTIQAAVGAGLLLPEDYGNRLSPDTPISRREIVLASVRALGKEALVGTQNAVLTASDASSYAAWLKSWAAVAVGDGILGGYPDGSLGLNRTATRAEALVMVQRILSKATMELTEFETAYRPGMVRHPGEGEPAWYFDGPATLRPTLTNGSQRYTFTEDAWGFSLMPAPGGALWVGYVVNGPNSGTYGVLARLAGGNLTEVARYENRSPRLLAVDESGRLWFSDARETLMLADRQGKIVASHAVGVVEQADLAWDGTLWAFGMQDSRAFKLIKVTPDGQVVVTEGQNQVWENVISVSAGEDGSVWLLTNLWNPEAGYLEARQYVDGKEVRRLPLLNRNTSGSDYAGGQVVGRSGPYLWVLSMRKVDPVTAAMSGLYKFDLNSGAFTPLVAPRSVSGGYGVLPAPGSGALLLDQAGKFWRILP